MTMDNNVINKKIKEIFCRVIGVKESEVNDDTAYDSFEPWDSLKHLEFIAEFEEEWNLDFEMDDVIAMETFKKVKDIVKKYIANKR